MIEFNATIYYRRCLCLLVLVLPLVVRCQQSMPLYANGKVPNAIPVTGLYDTLPWKSWLTGRDTTVYMKRTVMPTLTVFAPPPGSAKGIGVIVCSGGSYSQVADGWEGIPACKKLAAAGITAFLLHYRVPRSDMMVNKELGPQQDAQTAIKYVREHSAEYGIDKSRLGMMGFSAGGHLVSTAGTHYDSCYIDNENNTSLRPDFLVLVYPVISFADSLTHAESRANLVGPVITSDKIYEYSNELQVTAQTPPVFITHAVDDDLVKVENSLLFAAALEQQQVPVKLFLYSKGGHGFGVKNKTAPVQWIDACISWILQGAGAPAVR